jgi:two-component system chemotaxis response regulator CheY
MENKANILIIEDDELNQQLYHLLLGSQYNLVMCKNSVEFDKAIQSSKYDLFLVDITLQGMKNGLELIQELRLVSQYKTTPVIVVTANAFKVDEIAAYSAGATMFIRKPFSNKELRSAIERSLSDDINKEFIKN